MTALFSPQYLKWQELAKIFSVNKNWWQALTGLFSRSESSRRLPPFTGSVTLRYPKDVEGDTIQSPKRHPQLISNKWQGFIINRWPSGACFEPFFLNTSQGIFRGAQASPALLPWTNIDLSRSGVGWHQLCLLGGAGVVFVGPAPWPCPNPRANSPRDAPAGPNSLTAQIVNLLELPTSSSAPFLYLWASSQKQAGWRGNSLHLYLRSRWSWVRAKICT